MPRKLTSNFKLRLMHDGVLFSNVSWLSALLTNYALIKIYFRKKNQILGTLLTLLKLFEAEGQLLKQRVLILSVLPLCNCWSNDVVLTSE